MDDASCAVVRLHVDPNTAQWWSRQSQQARDGLLLDQLTLTEVALKFDAWWKNNRAVFVWSQGGNFDEPLWSAAMHAIGRRPPWKYVDARCTRTAYDMAKFNSFLVKRSGTYHNALDDARHQAVCVQRAYAKNEGRT